MRHAVLLLLLPLSACELWEDVLKLDGDDGDTGRGDSGAWREDITTYSGDGSPVIVGWVGECMDDETFVGTVFLEDGSLRSGVLDLWETGVPDEVAWNEEHAIVDGTVTLRRVFSVPDVYCDGSGGGTTLFGCGAAEQFDLDQYTLTYAVRVYDIDGNFADCIQFGHDPESVSSGDYTRIGGPPSNEDELASCRTLK